MNIQMNGLLANEEAESGINPTSEDLDEDAVEADGVVLMNPRYHQDQSK